MIKKLQMQMIWKIGFLSNSISKRENANWIKVCISLFLSLIAVNAFSQEITEFDLGGKPADRGWGIAAAPDGSVWIAERNGHRIERITPTGEITEYKTKDTEGEKIIVGNRPIALGPDGNMWLLEAANVARITANGEITQYVRSLGISRIIFAGPDGKMWFVLGNAIYKVDMQGIITEYDAKEFRTSRIMDTAVGQDGTVWYTAFGGKGNLVGKITRTGEITEYVEDSPTSVLIGNIAPGADGNMWFAANKELGTIAKITPSGAVTAYVAASDVIAGIGRLALGHDGNVWFANGNGRRIGNVAPDGKMIAYNLRYRKRIGENEIVSPANIEAGSPSDLTVDQHGNVWFTGPTMNWVGRLTIVPTTSPFNQAMSTPEIVSKIHTPTTQMELLQNVKIVMDVHLLSRDDFYSEENFKKIFGCKKLTVNENALVDTGIREATVFLSGCWKLSGPRGYGGITLRKTTKSNVITKASLDLSVDDDVVFPSMPEVDHLFGSDWEFGTIVAFDGIPDVHEIHDYKEKKDGKISSTMRIEDTHNSTLKGIGYFETYNETENGK